MATAVKTPVKQAAREAAPTGQRSGRAEQQTAAQETPTNDSSSSDAKGPQLSSQTSRSLLLILHGKRVDDDLVKNAISRLKDQGHDISVRVTFDSGDVDHFVSEAVKLNSSGVTQYQTIVAGGGDGTLNEVVCSLMKFKDELKEQNLSVALLPLGTANDFACVCGISVDPYAALCTALDPNNIHAIDVAAVNGQPFMNTAIAGSLAESSPEELNSKWKRLFGPAAIGFHVLKRLLQPSSLEPHKQVTITFCSEPGASPPSEMRNTSQNPSETPTDKSNNANNSSNKTKTVTADLLMLAAGNSRQMGRRVNVCPDALLDDGLLDFTLLTGQSLTSEAAGILGTLASRDPDHAACDRGIAQLKASWLEVKVAEGSTDKLPVNRDGEPEEANSRLLFEVYPQVLQFHMPDDRMLKQHKQLESAASSESVVSVGDIRGNIISEGTPTEAPAGAGTAADGKHGAKKHKKTKHRKLRKRTLQRMVVAVQPEGREVRRRAQLAKTGKALGKWTLVLLIGGSVGWLASARKHDSSKKEQKKFVQDGLVPASSHSKRKGWRLAA